MIRRHVQCGVLFAVLLALGSVAHAQDRTGPTDYWSPDLVYGTGGKGRTSPPFVVRRYKVEPDNPKKVAKEQPPNFVKTIENGYQLGADETFRVHEGVDLPSRPDPKKEPAPMEFKAGVYGRVLQAGGGACNTVTVQLADGSVVQYLHASVGTVKVNKGDRVDPNTVLAETGRTGAADIHLHIQARKNDKPIHPDTALRIGRRKPLTTIDDIYVKWVDFDVESSSTQVPNVKVVDGKVSITYDDATPKNMDSVAGSVWTGRLYDDDGSNFDWKKKWVFKANGELEEYSWLVVRDKDWGRPDILGWKQEGNTIIYKGRGGFETKYTIKNGEIEDKYPVSDATEKKVTRIFSIKQEKGNSK